MDLNIRDVPAELIRKLKADAATRGTSMRVHVLGILAKPHGFMSFGNVAERLNAAPDDGGNTRVEGSNPSVTAKPDMQALRDICAGKGLSFMEIDIPQGEHGTAARVEIPICGKTWWEDGEQYECLMDKGHKNPKHGMAGMVRKLDA